MTTTETIGTTRDLVRLTRRKRELTAEAKRVGDEIDKIEAALIEQWQDEGKSSETVDGHTVYISGRQWASPKDGDRLRVVRALEALGMDDMVTYNTATLSGWFKEQQDAGEEVPSDLAEVVDLTTNWSINVRRK